MVRTHIHKIRLLPLEVPAISLQCCNEIGEQLLRPAACTMHCPEHTQAGAKHRKNVSWMHKGRCRGGPLDETSGPHTCGGEFCLPSGSSVNLSSR